MSVPVPFLRSYPHNSPEAAARIVAVALIANGKIKAVETAALNAHVCHERLGMTEAQWHGVVHDLCADLLRSERSGDESRVSAHSDLKNCLLYPNPFQRYFSYL